MKKGKRDITIIFLGLLILLAISLVMTSVAATEPIVDADAETVGGDSLGIGSTVGAGDLFGSFFTTTLKEKKDIWLKGPEYLKEANGAKNLAELMKWYALILVIILIYSSLAYMRFPDNAFLRLLLSVATGFIATFFITTKELLTVMQSYSALGLAITTFFPIFVLTAITIVAATRFSPVTVFASKILWLGYSLFLLLRTGLLFLLTRAYTISYDATTKLASLKGNLPTILSPFFETSIKMVPKEVPKIGIDGKAMIDAAGNPTLETIMVPVREITQGAAEKIKAILANYDPTILFVLTIIAIAVIYFIVLNGKIYEYFDTMARESELSKQKSIIKRSQDLRKAEAEAMQDTGSNKV